MLKLIEYPWYPSFECVNLCFILLFVHSLNYEWGSYRLASMLDNSTLFFPCKEIIFTLALAFIIGIALYNSNSVKERHALCNWYCFI